MNKRIVCICMSVLLCLTIICTDTGTDVHARYYEDNDITKWEPQITVSDILGIRTFWDLQQNQQKHGDEAWQEKMLQLELRVSQMQEYKNIAFFHHLLLKK